MRLASEHGRHSERANPASNTRLVDSTRRYMLSIAKHRLLTPDEEHALALDREEGSTGDPPVAGARDDDVVVHRIPIYRMEGCYPAAATVSDT